MTVKDKWQLATANVKKKKKSPDVILCGWLGPKHQPPNYKKIKKILAKLTASILKKRSKTYKR